MAVAEKKIQSDMIEISRADLHAITAELARLRLLEKAMRNFAQADCAVRELLKASGC